jgi:hypothetical protein
MALIDVLCYQTKENDFVWKFPSNDLKIGTQVLFKPEQYTFSSKVMFLWIYL